MTGVQVNRGRLEPVAETSVARDEVLGPFSATTLSSRPFSGTAGRYFTFGRGPEAQPKRTSEPARLFDPSAPKVSKWDGPPVLAESFGPSGVGARFVQTGHRHEQVCRRSYLLIQSLQPAAYSLGIPSCSTCRLRHG